MSLLLSLQSPWRLMLQRNVLCSWSEPSQRKVRHAVSVRTRHDELKQRSDIADSRLVLRSVQRWPAVTTAGGAGFVHHYFR